MRLPSLSLFHYKVMNYDYSKDTKTWVIMTKDTPFLSICSKME